MKNLKYILPIIAMSCGNSELQATRDKLDNAVREGRVAELKEMLKDNPDLNGTDYKQDYNATHVAAKYNQLEALEMILEAGADPNVIGFDNTSGMQLGITHGNVEITKMFILSGADVNGVDILGNTALHFAAIYGRRDIARMLLRTKGMDASIKNKDGKTALDIAIEEEKTDIVKLLS